MPTPGSRSSGQVRALNRALTLLCHLAESERGLSLTELAGAVGYAPSTTHRLLTTLEANCFVRSEPATGNWRIGVAAFVVGSAFARSRSIRDLVLPYLRRMTDLSGETASVFVLSDGKPICTAEVESPHAMRVSSGLGGRVMLHASASGKALLAHRDPGERDHLLGSAPYRQATAATLTGPTAFEAALAGTRGFGYALEDEEQAIGQRGAAAPIFDELGESVAAISVCGPSARIDRHRLPLLGRQIALAVCRIWLS